MCSVAVLTMKKKRSGKKGARRAGGGARLGQHFLTGLWAAQKLTEAIAVQKGETILEIGPGTGALTTHLLSTGAKVVAVEKDEKLCATLQGTCAREIASGTLTLIEGDVRDLDVKKIGLKRYVVAANIPYYITGEILRHFLTTSRQPRAMALLMQKEVAQRIVAGNGKESILSISVKAYGAPTIVSYVSKGNFSPPPSVDSAILLIEHISKDFFVGMSEEHFFDVVKGGFASKRKLLLGNLAKKFDKDLIMHAASVAQIEDKARAEDLTLDEWRALAQELS